MGSKRKRKRPTIPLEEVLGWLLDGTLVVDLETAEVVKAGKPIKSTYMGTNGRNGQRYRVELCSKGRKRTISRARLVYMAGSMALVPPGYEVHHLDGDRYNDSWPNLVALTAEDHLKWHRAANVAGVPF